MGVFLERKKVMLKREKNKGFSLVELIVVIAIMAVLVGVIAPQFLGYKDRAKESILKYNTQGLYNFVSVHSVDYDKDKWWGEYENDSDKKDETMNNYLEKELEIKREGKFSNDLSIVNPFNNNMGILNWKTTFNTGNSYSEDAYRPAVFMTSNSSFSYEGGGSTKNLVGTIVAYFKVDDGVTEYIQFYYVNEDGSKSDLVLKW